jgi:RecJ-like exonuclease
LGHRKAKSFKSEGPQYWIQPIDDYKERWAEVTVRKTVQRWQNDPLLHDLIDKMVVIRGEIIETKSTITVDPIEVEELKE